MEDKKFKVIIVEDVKLELKGTEEIHKYREPSQISYHQSRDSVMEHHDAPLWISRTKELRTLK
jgi:hypothetical protein